jgi:hypothetical protein
MRCGCGADGFGVRGGFDSGAVGCLHRSGQALRLSSSIMMTSLINNVRYGLRQIRRSPRFSAIELREALRAE